KISSTYSRRAVLSTALEKSMPRFGPSARYSPGGRRGGGEAPPGGSAQRRMSGAERQGGDLLTPWKYSARQRISSTYLRRAVLSLVVSALSALAAEERPEVPVPEKKSLIRKTLLSVEENLRVDEWAVASRDFSATVGGPSWSIRKSILHGGKQE